MDDAKKLRTWRVEGTVPKEATGHTYAQNVNLIVYAKTLEEVVAVVHEKHPAMSLLKIMGDRWAHDVIVVQDGGKVTDGE